MKRRTFIYQASAAAGGLVLSPSTFGASSKRISPNDKLQFGVIGCNGMGWSNTNSLLRNKQADLIAICDVDQNVVQRRLGNYSKMRNNTPDTYRDYRKLLENDQIDAVVVGTPDHWHCKVMIDALEAGKHVYVEKPIANTIEECKLMVAAAKKYGKIVQVGQWQRSGPHYRSAIDWVQSGKLGNIRLVKAWAYQGWMDPVNKVADSEVPKGVDYDFWLGPAPKRAFNKNRFHFNFRWFWDYAGGLMTDWGVHEIDIALYAMGAKAPISVMASGGKLAYPDDASETPDTLQAIFQYEGFNMLWEHATGIDQGPYGRREGIAFIGNNGTLVVDRNGFEILTERESKGYSSWGKDKMEKVESFKRPKNVNYLGLHTQNFLDAIVANDASILNTPIDSGSVAAINAQMGNISFKTGRKLYWDDVKGNFKEDAEANKLIYSNYHNGWELPKL